MNTYRQKPIDVRAVRFDADLDVERTLKWIRSHGVSSVLDTDTLNQPFFRIGLPEGVLEWRFGSWLVKDPATQWSEFTIYSHDAFLAGHEVPLAENLAWPAATGVGVPAVRFADGAWKAPS